MLNTRSKQFPTIESKKSTSSTSSESAASMTNGAIYVPALTTTSSEEDDEEEDESEDFFPFPKDHYNAQEDSEDFFPFPKDHYKAPASTLNAETTLSSRYLKYRSQLALQASPARTVRADSVPARENETSIPLSSPNTPLRTHLGALHQVTPDRQTSPADPGASDEKVFTPQSPYLKYRSNLAQQVTITSLSPQSPPLTLPSSPQDGEENTIINQQKEEPNKHDGDVHQDESSSRPLNHSPSVVSELSESSKHTSLGSSDEEDAEKLEEQLFSRLSKSLVGAPGRVDEPAAATSSPAVMVKKEHVDAREDDEERGVPDGADFGVVSQTKASDTNQQQTDDTTEILVSSNPYVLTPLHSNGGNNNENSKDKSNLLYQAGENATKMEDEELGKQGSSSSLILMKQKGLWLNEQLRIFWWAVFVVLLVGLPLGIGLGVAFSNKEE